ncbi:MAG: hypothetical protein IPJ88_07710 [Myxococcales bacterium]|nr:MAG: hypothetical protein IPJ88_07710 [Myxococcales bacterium]
MLNSKQSRFFYFSVLGILLSVMACDSVPQADRSVFGPNGEKWCFEYNAWKHINSDRLNCGECNSPCQNDQVCFQGECIASESDNPINNPSATTSNGQQFCSYYASCFSYGCNAACEDDSECAAVEEACAVNELDDMSVDELRSFMGGQLFCEPSTGQCVAQSYELPPDPVDDGTGNAGDGSGYVAPPPPTNSDTSCGSSHTNCTLTDKVCDNGVCVCTGCELNGTCYSEGQSYFLWSWPGTVCGATCFCGSNGWAGCSAKPYCPV